MHMHVRLKDTAPVFEPRRRQAAYNVRACVRVQYVCTRPQIWASLGSGLMARELHTAVPP